MPVSKFNVHLANLFYAQRARWLVVAWSWVSLVAIAAPPADMAERVKPCEACHGQQGRAGPDGYYPRLAGKPAGYLYNQMQNFAQGKRHYELMRRMVTPLSPEYQQEMAQYFASLTVPYLPPAKNAALLSEPQRQRGRQLAQEGDSDLKLPACSTCHGEQLMGNNAHVPSLLGLPAAYLGAQLSAWQLGQRSTAAPDCMAHLAKQLSTDDIAAVSAWLASQPVPTQTLSPTPTPRAQIPRCASAPELHKAAP